MLVCGHAESLPEAQDQAAKCNPDIVLLDVAMPGMQSASRLPRPAQSATVGSRRGAPINAAQASLPHEDSVVNRQRGES